jgi:hypothetical protein
VLQHVRDEAHRFGQHYHHLLRRKRAFDEDVAAGRRPPPKPRRKPRRGEVVLDSEAAQTEPTPANATETRFEGDLPDPPPEIIEPGQSPLLRPVADQDTARPDDAHSPPA